MPRVSIPHDLYQVNMDKIKENFQILKRVAGDVFTSSSNPNSRLKSVRYVTPQGSQHSQIVIKVETKVIQYNQKFLKLLQSNEDPDKLAQNFFLYFGEEQKSIIIVVNCLQWQEYSTRCYSLVQNQIPFLYNEQKDGIDFNTYMLKNENIQKQLKDFIKFKSNLKSWLHQFSQNSLVTQLGSKFPLNIFMPEAKFKKIESIFNKIQLDLHLVFELKESASAKQIDELTKLIDNRKYEILEALSSQNQIYKISTSAKLKKDPYPNYFLPTCMLALLVGSLVFIGFKINAAHAKMINKKFV